MKTVRPILIFALLLMEFTLSGQHYEFINSEKFSTQTKFALDTIRYFYYPNLEAYFDTKETVYIYRKEGQWIRNKTIPGDYRGYCLFNNHYEIINGLMDEIHPEKFIEKHKKEFPPIFTAKAMRLKLDKEKAGRLSYSTN